FFSSRRRHTRFSRDWSSDVCSSDLNFNRANVCEDDAVVFENTSTTPYGTLSSFWEFGDGFTSVDDNPSYTYPGFGTFNVTLVSRSEERRVGKECRCGWWAYGREKHA